MVKEMIYYLKAVEFCVICKKASQESVSKVKFKSNYSSVLYKF